MSSSLTPEPLLQSSSALKPEDAMHRDFITHPSHKRFVNGNHPTDGTLSSFETMEFQKEMASKIQNTLELATPKGSSLPRKRKQSSPDASPEANAASEELFPKSIKLSSSKELQSTNNIAEQDWKANIEELSDLLRGRMYGLDAALWQHIFCFVPPVFLGCLLRVSRRFRFLLTRMSGEQVHTSRNAPVRVTLRTSESIWAASRKRFAPGLPKPLKIHQELDMWKLLRGSSCQLCGQKKALITTGINKDPWHCGPGVNGVRVIWPFGTRSCGPCLTHQCEQEVSILCSSTFPSFLLQGLPCIFLTQSQDYVAPDSLANALPPSDVRIKKFYYKPHLQEIQKRFKEAKELSVGSLDEWLKGLDGQQREHTQDVTRWEQWEAKGGLKKVNARPLPKPNAPVRRVSATTNTPMVKHHATHSEAQKAILGPDSLNVHGHAIEASPTSWFSRSLLHPANTTYFAGQEVAAPYQPVPPPHVPNIRIGRNIRDVNEAKAARRAEIERRCMAMEPPIPPNVLIHMESFQAALQISTPLTERAWEVLQPRLEAQRKEAEARAAATADHAKASQAAVTTAERDFHSHLSQKDAGEPSDREWELVQSPIRERLAAYADKIISEKWAAGAGVGVENAPNFAADVLLSARDRFCADSLRSDVRSNGLALEQPHLTSPKLTLENMKWLYDQKVKNLAESMRKELFLCNGCEVNYKYYGFEAVLQHYAAKHTSSLSLGNVVVNWRAEWPEQPPFDPSPCTAWSASHTNIASWSPGLAARHGAAAQPVLQTQANSMFGDDPYANNNTTSTTGFDAAVYSAATTSMQQSTLPPYPNTFSAQRDQYFHTSGHGYSGPPHPQHYSHLPTERLLNDGSVPGTHSTNPGLPQEISTTSVSTIQPAATAPSPNGYLVSFPGGDLYHAQMNEMAKHARDVWFGTSGIKDIPQSVRIYVVIQHVVCRFEKRYTNEPSLSMFIDGLDHNPLMRPVRSLNGLACKSCVTIWDSEAGDVLPSDNMTSEKKLYTLPHLLNHFRTVHLESSQLSVDVQTGMESSRLDWKHDMIALPEPSLISTLIDAPGIDDRKLQLIAWVFPELFPNPLPKLASRSSSKATQRFDSGSKNAVSRDNVPMTQLLSSRDSALGSSEGIEDLRSRSLQSLDYPRYSPQGHGSPREDEYDPHRPAYLGRIIESHQLKRPSLQLSLPDSQPSTLAHHLNGAETRSSEFNESAKRRDKGAYSDQLLRHHDSSSRRAQAWSRIHPEDKAPPKRERQVTTDVLREPLSPNHTSKYDSRQANFAAADKFLDSLSPVADVTNGKQSVDLRVPFSGNLSTQYQHSTSPAPAFERRNDQSDYPHSGASRERYRYGDSLLALGDGNDNYGAARKATRTPADRLPSGNSPQSAYREDGPSPYGERLEVVGEIDHSRFEYRIQPKASFVDNVGREYYYHEDPRPSRTDTARLVHSNIVYHEVPGGEPRDHSLPGHQSRFYSQSAVRNADSPGIVEYIRRSNGQSNAAYSNELGERVEYIPLESTWADVNSGHRTSTFPLASNKDQLASDRRSPPARFSESQVFYVSSDQVHSSDPLIARDSRGIVYSGGRNGYW